MPEGDFAMFLGENSHELESSRLLHSIHVDTVEQHLLLSTWFVEALSSRFAGAHMVM